MTQNTPLARAKLLKIADELDRTIFGAKRTTLATLIREIVESQLRKDFRHRAPRRKPDPLDPGTPSEQAPGPTAFSTVNKDGSLEGPKT